MPTGKKTFDPIWLVYGTIILLVLVEALILVGIKRQTNPENGLLPEELYRTIE